jgi:signal peptidase I
MRKTTGWALGILAWAAASIATLLLALAFLPTLFGLRTLIVSSGSMGRSMPIGSVALTRAVLAQAIDVGDMISFRYRGDGETITHRVVAIEKQVGQFAFTTKGDANQDIDTEKVIVALRVHRVETVVPLAGHVIRYARTPLGGFALIFVPIVGLVVDRRGRQSGAHVSGRSPIRTRRRRPVDLSDFGWSTTTYHLVRVSPHVLRGDPGG